MKLDRNARYDLSLFLASLFAAFSYYMGLKIMGVLFNSSIFSSNFQLKSPLVQLTVYKLDEFGNLHSCLANSRRFANFVWFLILQNLLL